MFTLLLGAGISIVASIATGVLLNRHSSQVAEQSAIRIRRRERFEEAVIKGLLLLSDLQIRARNLRDAINLQVSEAEPLRGFSTAVSNYGEWEAESSYLVARDRVLLGRLSTPHARSMVALMSFESPNKLEKDCAPSRLAQAHR